MNQFSSLPLLLNIIVPLSVIKVFIYKKNLKNQNNNMYIIYDDSMINYGKSEFTWFMK